MPTEAPRKLNIHKRVEDFSKKTYEQAAAKKVLVRNLKALMHKVVRVRRTNLMRAVTHSSIPLGMIQPGLVLSRRVGDTDWGLKDDKYNVCRYGEDFPSLVGMVVGYEVVEKESGGSAYLIVAIPNDRFEYRFDLSVSEIEVLDGFPNE